MACASEPPPEDLSQPLLRPRQDPAAPGASSAPLAGLTPLPSAEQVVASVQSGRTDPFAPLGAAGASGRPAPLSLPPGLVFNGVIRSGGTPEALVQFAGESGTVRVGQRGGGSGADPRSTSLLPAGWSVARIDVQQGRLTLRQGKQTLTVPL